MKYVLHHFSISFIMSCSSCNVSLLGQDASTSCISLFSTTQCMEYEACVSFSTCRVLFILLGKELMIATRRKMTHYECRKSLTRAKCLDIIEHPWYLPKKTHTYSRFMVVACMMSFFKWGVNKNWNNGVDGSITRMDRPIIGCSNNNKAFLQTHM